MIVIVIVIVIVNSNSDNEYNKDEENVVVKQDTWGGAGERTTSCQEII